MLMFLLQWDFVADYFETMVATFTQVDAERYLKNRESREKCNPIHKQ